MRCSGRLIKLIHNTQNINYEIKQRKKYIMSIVYYKGQCEINIFGKMIYQLGKKIYFRHKNQFKSQIY